MKDSIAQAYAAVEKGKIEKIELPIPEIDDYEALVENEGCVFCNLTDRLIIENLFVTPDYPVLFGHESFGKVVKVGSKVKKYKIGDRVICSNVAVKGKHGDYYSRWGGFATHGVVGDLDAYINDGGDPNGENAYRQRYVANAIIPNDFSVEQASLIFPLAEMLGAIIQVGDIKDKRVLIIGTNVVACFFSFFAKYLGASEVICVKSGEEKVDLALKCGADKGFDDREGVLNYLKETGLVDIVFECSGNLQIFEEGLPFLKEEGTLAIFSEVSKCYSVNFKLFPKKINFFRIAPHVDSALESVCKLMREGRIPVETFLTHKLTFDRVSDLYEAVKRGEVIKGLVYIKK